MAIKDPFPTDDTRTVFEAVGEAAPARTGEPTPATQPCLNGTRNDGLPDSPHRIPGYSTVR